MQFTSLHVKGFSRFKLIDSDEVVFNFTQREQIILGTNGSGKSSMMELLTPLPPNKDDFKKDGFKKITIHHKGFEYIILTTFERGMRTSILKDGEELNPGGTTSIARDIIKEEFGITPAIHQLMIGATRFTRMTAAARKEWMMLLASADYTYALGKFHEFKERYNEIYYSLKNDRKRLAVESEKLLPAEELIRLNQVSQDLTSRIEELNKMRRLDVTQVSIHDLNQKTTKLMSDVDKTLIFVNKQARIINRSTPFSSKEDLVSAIDESANALASNETLLKVRLQDHDTVSKDLAILTNVGSGSDADIMDRLSTNELAIQDLEQQLKLGLEITHPEQVLGAIVSIENDLIGQLSNIKSNDEHYFNQAKVAEYTQRQASAFATLTTQRDLVNKAETRYEHMTGHSSDVKVECPECKNRFVAKVSQSQLDDAKKYIHEQRLHLVKLEENHTYIANLLEEQQHYFISVETIYRILQRAGLESFKDLLIRNNAIHNGSAIVMNYINQYKRDCELTTEIKRLMYQRQSLKETLTQLQQLENRNIDALKETLASISKEVEELTNHATYYRARNSELKNLLVIMEQMERAKDFILLVQSEMNTHAKQVINYHFQVNLDKLIQDLQIQLATCVNATVAAKQQIAIVEKLKASVEEKTVQEAALKIIVAAMSPNDGLIAESLMGFIKGFVSQMNNLIKKVWTYSLRIKPCRKENQDSVELDYKFPVVVRGEEPGVPDVAMTSTGMSEIIDLAFKIVAMVCLKLNHHPLFLDEFAASFDVTHRQAAVNSIKWLLDNQPYGQLWMITHYEDTISAFPNAQIAVLCSDNVSFVADYNKHVKFI